MVGRPSLPAWGIRALPCLASRKYDNAAAITPQPLLNVQLAIHVHIHRILLDPILVWLRQGCDLVSPDIGTNDQTDAMQPDCVHKSVGSAAAISGLVDRGLEELFAANDHLRMRLVEHHQPMLGSRKIAFQSGHHCVRAIQDQSFRWPPDKGTLYESCLADSGRTIKHKKLIPVQRLFGIVLAPPLCQLRKVTQFFAFLASPPLYQSFVSVLPA